MIAIGLGNSPMITSVERLTNRANMLYSNVLLGTKIELMLQSTGLLGGVSREAPPRLSPTAGDQETMATYTPQHVANFFLDKGFDEGRPITQLKLIKLVYIAHGWNLALTGNPLYDEQVQAWRYGPVIPSVYHEFKHFGRKPIDGFAEHVDLETWDVKFPRIPEHDAVTLKILGHVWHAYRKFTGEALIEKTHEKGSPWQQTYEEGRRFLTIEDDLIREHFEERIAAYVKEAKRAQQRTGSQAA